MIEAGSLRLGQRVQKPQAVGGGSLSHRLTQMNTDKLNAGRNPANLCLSEFICG
jgi:hypothetical protein